MREIAKFYINKIGLINGKMKNRKNSPAEKRIFIIVF